jgi:LPXTG-motif cell wall-anchored protein
MSAEEATINTDGTSSFPSDSNGGGPSSTDGEDIPLNTSSTADDTMNDTIIKTATGIDPAFYVLFGFLLLVGLYYIFIIRKKGDDNDDDFFTSLDGEKVRCY